MPEGPLPVEAATLTTDITALDAHFVGAEIDVSPPDLIVTTMFHNDVSVDDEDHARRAVLQAVRAYVPAAEIASITLLAP